MGRSQSDRRLESEGGSQTVRGSQKNCESCLLLRGGMRSIIQSLGLSASHSENWGGIMNCSSISKVCFAKAILSFLKGETLKLYFLQIMTTNR